MAKQSLLKVAGKAAARSAIDRSVNAKLGGTTLLGKIVKSILKHGVASATKKEKVR